MDSKQNWGIGWVLAFLGFPIGGVLAVALISRLETPLDGLLGGAVAGLAIGAAQWLALRRRLPVDWRWIVTTAVAMGLGLALGVLLFGAATTVEATLLRALPTGLLIGVAQAWLLRTQMRYAALWAVATTLLYVAAWFITAQVIGRSLDIGFVVFGASGAIVFQALTGVVLWGLLRLDRRPALA